MLRQVLWPITPWRTLAGLLLALLVPACQGRTALGTDESASVVAKPILCVARAEAPDECETDGSPLDWGPIAAGTASTLELTIKNRGKGPLELYSLRVTATTPEAYLFDARICEPPCEQAWSLPATLAPGSMAHLRLNFDAAVDGLMPAETLELASNDLRDRSGIWGVYQRPFAGVIEGCVADHIDANGDLADGCECQPAAPIETSCDGNDDDCNGLVDEALEGSGAACDTGLLGACQGGSFRCLAGVYSCIPDNEAGSERCDGVDNDCDGSVDEEGSWQHYNDGLSGGVVNAVAFDSRATGVAYAALGSRVYRSDDAGTSFDFVGEASAGVNAFGFPPGAPETVLASSGSGLLRSPDGGATWSVAALEGFGLGPLLVHPADPQRIYVGTAGAGILRSNDGGTSFVPAGGGLPYCQVISLDGDPDDPHTVVAAVYVLDAQGGWSGEGRILRTTDAGVTWVTVLDAVGRVPSIARCPDDPSRLYAAVLGNGLARSEDGGEHWSFVALPAANAVDVAVGSSDCNIVYVSKYPDGMYRSTNGAVDFVGPLASGMDMQFPGEIHVAVDPSNAETVVAATHGGAFVTDTSGDSWARAENINGISVRRLASSPADPAEAWVATWGQGVWARPSDAVPWQRMSAVVLPSDWTFTVAGHPADADQIIVGGWGDLWRSSSGGADWTAVLSQVNAMAIAYDPVVPSNVLVGTQLYGVYRSVDSGVSWEQSNAGLPDPWPTGIGPLRDIRSVAFDPTDGSVAFLGTNGQGVFLTTDGGLSWQVGGQELGGTHVTCLVATLGVPSRLYACVEHEGLWLSDDQGQTFAPASEGLPTLEVSGLVIDHATGVLYATTSMGVFRWEDDSSWADLDSACLPSTGAGSPIIVSGAGGRVLLVASSAGGVAALPL